jgi:hypothetical protein
VPVRSAPTTLYNVDVDDFTYILENWGMLEEDIRLQQEANEQRVKEYQNGSNVSNWEIPVSVKKINDDTLFANGVKASVDFDLSDKNFNIVAVKTFDLSYLGNTSILQSVARDPNLNNTYISDVGRNCIHLYRCWNYVGNNFKMISTKIELLKNRRCPKVATSAVYGMFKRRTVLFHHFFFENHFFCQMQTFCHFLSQMRK